MIRFRATTDQVVDMKLRGVDRIFPTSEPEIWETAEKFNHSAYEKDFKTVAAFIELFGGTVLETRHDGFEKSPEPDPVIVDDPPTFFSPKKKSKK